MGCRSCGYGASEDESFQRICKDCGTTTDPQCVNQDKLLPVLSNAKMNEYLKEMANGVRSIRRWRFIRRGILCDYGYLGNGVPIETVSKMLGHKTLRTTQQYVKILDRKVSDDMRRSGISSIQDQTIMLLQP